MEKVFNVHTGEKRLCPGCGSADISIAGMCSARDLHGEKPIFKCNSCCKFIMSSTQAEKYIEEELGHLISGPVAVNILNNSVSSGTDAANIDIDNSILASDIHNIKCDMQNISSNCGSIGSMEMYLQELINEIKGLRQDLKEKPIADSESLVSLISRFSLK